MQRINKILSSIILSICLIARCIYINIKYPSYKEQNFNINEEVNLNGITYHVGDVRIFSNDKYKEVFSSPSTSDPKENFLLVNLIAENTTEDVRKIPIDNFRLETEGWSSNISVESLFYLNKNLKSYNYNLSENESINLCLPFTYYYDETNEKRNSQCIEDFQFSLCLYMDYPEKISILL